MSDLFCKTKSGIIYKVWSDNVDEQTMHVYPHDEEFDAESTNTTIVKYGDILDTNENKDKLL